MLFGLPKYRFIAACVACCFFMLGCENSDEEIDNLYKKRMGTEVAHDIELIYTTGGKTKAILRAPLMNRITDSISHYEFPESVKADFYNLEGEVETILTAGYGDYMDVKNLVLLRDSVKVINLKRGDTLYTDKLYWDRSRLGREFYTDEAVKIRTRTERLDGEGLEASQDLKHKMMLRARGPVSVPENNIPY